MPGPVAEIMNASANVINAGTNIASGIQKRLERKQQAEQWEKNHKLEQQKFAEDKQNNELNRKLSIKDALEKEKQGGLARNMARKQDYRQTLQANADRRKANAFMTGVKDAFNQSANHGGGGGINGNGGI